MPPRDEGRLLVVRSATVATGLRRVAIAASPVVVAASNSRMASLRGSAAAWAVPIAMDCEARVRIAWASARRKAGVPVGIAVDGSASNDSGHLLGETRQAMLLARVGHGPAAMSARQALELATLGGAKVLGRDDIGALAPGMSADVVAFQTGGLDLAGAAAHDPVASLIFCTPQNVRHSIINGKPVVSDGILLTVELQPLIAQHNRLARELVEKSPRRHST